ncbi:MAG: fumarylacetoacetase [Bacteroidetes bacterium HGW-Bacteroidetes-1]|jgi:fumarylacetoacetase|nr:MAG: fumarylacetoacetase [Bacteroidetes bacterium HGW-Bacteroidetes-1]
MKTWIQVPENNDFPIQNIPFGIIAYDQFISPATRIGNTVIDLSILADFGYFDALDLEDLSVFYQPVLNDFISLGKNKTNAIRTYLQNLFSLNCDDLKDNAEVCSLALKDVDSVLMMMPVAVGDYTDFYSSIEHATNVGTMFRDPGNALLPNWRHLPVGYHGRSSSIVVSGTSVYRPKGQTRPDENQPPIFGPSKQVDFELEMAFITNGKTKLGASIDVNKAEDFIFGLIIFNDLSARDLQKWEYVPLGPFLSKSFGSVVSPWIVTLEALEPFRVKGPLQEPQPLPYLQNEGEKNLDIQLEVFIKPEKSESNLVCRSNFKYMYWNMAQQLAHQTVAGCNINTGDMYGSGTISGPTSDSYGSMLELSWKGTKPLILSDGSSRTFIQDNDTIVMKAFAKKDNLRIGFGDCLTKILSAT